MCAGPVVRLPDVIVKFVDRPCPTVGNLESLLLLAKNRLEGMKMRQFLGAKGALMAIVFGLGTITWSAPSHAAGASDWQGNR